MKDVPYQEAFFALSAARGSGMGGPNPIPVSELLAYLNLMGIASYTARSKYLRLVQQMDSTYLGHCAEKAAQTKP